MTPHAVINVPVQHLRRVAEALAELHGRTIMDTRMRSDLRQMRVELTEDLVVVIAAEVDEEGRPRLEVDVVRSPEEPERQLEVRFDRF